MDELNFFQKTGVQISWKQLTLFNVQLPRINTLRWTSRRGWDLSATSAMQYYHLRRKQGRLHKAFGGVPQHRAKCGWRPHSSLSFWWRQITPVGTLKAYPWPPWTVNRNKGSSRGPFYAICPCCICLLLQFFNSYCHRLSEYVFYAGLWSLWAVLLIIFEVMTERHSQLLEFHFWTRLIR